MKITLNIGLARNDGKPDNTILRAVAVLNQCGFLIYSADIQMSSTEHTLCATVQHVKHRGFLKFDLHNVASRLGQDCIAAAYIDSLNGKIIGEMHGPEVGKWGKFDSQYFLFPHAKEAA